MDPHQLLLLPASYFLLFFAPGFVVLKNTGLKRASKAETILLSVALSLALIPIFSSLMDFFAAISEVGIVAVYFPFVIFLSFLHFLSNRCKSNVESRRTCWPSFPKRDNIKKIILLASVAGLAFANWHSAIGIHSIDMGTHVFWTQEILATNRIPDYSIVEPLDQASRFTYGPHVLIAEISLLSTVPVDEIFWLLAVVFSFANLVAVILIAQRVSGSFYAGLVSGIFYGTAFLSGGYIQRGNIADIFGFFLLTSLILIIELVEVENLSVILAPLLLVSIFIFHPYAGLAAAAGMVVFFILTIIAHHRRAIGLLKPVRAQLNYFPFWVVIILLAGISISKLPYANFNSPGQLQSSNWSEFVTPLSYYPNLIGPILLVFGILGMIIVWYSKATRRLILTSWIVVLFLLANGPRWYLQVESTRFLWRMIEPLSVFAGIGIYSIYYFLSARTESIANLRFLKIQITHKTDRSRKTFRFCLVTCICTIMIVPSFALLTSLDRHAVAEPFLEADKSLGNWLYQNTNSTDVILVNADVDNTATWIQVFASRPHFLYKVEFATRVAVLPYRQIFLDMSSLYNNAFYSTALLDILKKYDVSYIVVHGSDVSKFMASPFLTPIYITNQATIFKPFLRTSYGEVISAEGWWLNTTSGRQIALLTELEITYTVFENVNLTIQINSHVTDPPIPATGFAAYIDGNFYEQRLIEDGTIADIHTDYSKFWPSLRKSGVGNSYLLTITLEGGVHSIRIVKTSDSDFEIYASDLVSQGIIFDPAFLHS